MNEPLLPMIGLLVILLVLAGCVDRLIARNRRREDAARRNAIRGIDRYLKGKSK